MEPTGRREAPPDDRLRDIRVNDDILIFDDEGEQLAVALRIIFPARAFIASRSGPYPHGRKGQNWKR
jgi:hypothetical protein